MIKIIGAVFILIATSWIGFEASKNLSERTRQLRLWKLALQSLEAEIMFGHAPLHEAARRIANQVDPPIGQIFHQFQTMLVKEDMSANEAWKTSLNVIWNKTALKRRNWKF